MQSLILPPDPFALSVVVMGGQQVYYSLPGIAREDGVLLRTWLDGKAEKTVKAYAQDVTRFYTWLLEKYPPLGKSLAQLTLEDVQGFKNSLTTLKPSSQARTTAAIKSLLTFGAKTGILPFNVGAVVKLPKIEDTLAERITSEQNIARLFALEDNPRNHAILVLLYRGGLRAAELCQLKWRNLQERNEAGQVSLFGKGSKSRPVLLDQETWQEVMQLRTPEATADDYVFSSRQAHSRKDKADRRLDESMVHRIVKEAAIRAKIELYTKEDGKLSSRVSPHWLRHAHASHAQDHGAPIALVRDTMGHKSIETTAKYSHVRPNESSATYLKV